MTWKMVVGQSLQSPESPAYKWLAARWVDRQSRGLLVLPSKNSYGCWFPYTSLRCCPRWGWFKFPKFPSTTEQLAQRPCVSSRL